MPLPPLHRTASWPAALGPVLRGALVALFLFGSLLLINFLQTLSLVLRPFSQHAFRRVNRWFADRFWSWCAWTTRSVHRTRAVMTGDSLPAGENALVIVNHQTMTDVQVLFLLARKAGRLGDLKWFVKDSLKYAPGFGWGMTFLDCLFVKRDWTADRAHIDRVFRRVVSGRVPLWLISFSEGTRLTAEKLARARRYAAEHALALPRHVQLPRAKGFVASVTGLQGHIHAVYDVTIGYVDGLPSLWQWAKGEMREVHLHVRRFAAAELPSAPEALAEWLRDRFEEKDERLEQFYTAGSLA
jgi:1-acyl-sn-glycerol-3-phosphate acyltransferase